MNPNRVSNLRPALLLLVAKMVRYEGPRDVTYGAVGDQIGYWRFFPAPEGMGRIPVWGFARVVRSNAADAPEGLRLFGYWPMSSHTVARLVKRPSGYVEASAHRAELPPTYNAYQAAEPGAKEFVSVGDTVRFCSSTS